MFKSTAEHREIDEPLLSDSRGHDRQDEPEEQHMLDNLSQSTVFEEAEHFATTHNLSSHAPLFQKAALLIQSLDTPLDQIPNLSHTELNALRNETAHKWRQPKMLYFTFLVCSLGAVVQGWSQTGINGANLSFPTQFGIGSESAHDTMLVGLINSAPYLSSGLFGAWLSDPINNRLGRRGTVFLGSTICLISSLGCGIIHNWQQLLIFRVLLGVGMGINASTVNVYAAECAPASIRGGLAVSWQMWTAFGIFCGFVANVLLYDFGETAWRLQLSASAIPAIPILFTVLLCPESPYWHMKHNRNNHDQAFRSLNVLRNTPLQAARELYYVHLQQRQRSKLETDDETRSFGKKFIELFSIPRNRRATIAAYVVMLSQQLCGINLLAFYSSTIFLSSGFTPLAALKLSSLFGLINFIFAIPAIWAMDTLGRRTLLLITLPPMAATMFLAGLSFAIPNSNPLHFWLLTTLVYVFCALYSPGMGPVPPIYAAEIFPLPIRDIGMSLAVSVANLHASFLSLTFPALLALLTPLWTFTLYAGLNVLAWTLVWCFVRETKGRTLDELDAVFGEDGVGAFIRERWAEVVIRVWRRGKTGEGRR